MMSWFLKDKVNTHHHFWEHLYHEYSEYHPVDEGNFVPAKLEMYLV